MPADEHEPQRVDPQRDFDPAEADSSHDAGDWDDDAGPSGTTRASGPSGGAPQDVRPKPSGTSIAKYVGVGVLALAGILALFRSPKPAMDETVHANWNQHVVELNDRFANQGQSVVKLVNAGGVATFGTQLEFGDRDRDDATTSTVQQALSQGDLAAAAAAVEAAQKIPPLPADAADTVQVRKPELTEGMREAIVNGDAQFFHVYLYDSCDEDGDVVDVIINGQLFATVPITNQGATLSVPVNTGAATNVEIRGVRDGFGGITVACRTSQGDYFMRCMMVGEVQPLAIIK